MVWTSLQVLDTDIATSSVPLTPGWQVAVREMQMHVQMSKTLSLPPGTPTPRSGIYEQVGPRGGRTGEQADSTRGKPLPPTDGPGRGSTLVQPAHHKGKK
jgi:hypothetical protein